MEVTTSALSASNNAYAGGLVIMGKSSSGHFTMPIDYNASGANNSVTIELPKGLWTFSAVAWNGASAMQGTTHCGAVVVDLKDDSQTVNLGIASSNCNTQTGYFGDASYWGSVSFDALNIATCGWLYKNTTPDVVDATTAVTFCNSGASIPEEYKKWAKSLKVEVLKNMNGALSSGLASSCYNTSDGIAYTSLSIPSQGLPLLITLYDETGCPDADVTAKYDFPRGIAVAEAAQDSLLNNVSSSSNLIIPSNDTKRGYSGFLALLPKIECGGAPCINVPADTPSSSSFIIRSDVEFVFMRNPTSTQTCANISTVSTDSGSFTPALTAANFKARCRANEDGDLVTSINFSSISSPVITVTWADTSSIGGLSFTTDASFDIYEIGWENFGYPAGASVVNRIRDSFRFFYDDDDMEFGLVTDVREMLGPQGAGGVLGNVNCTTDTKDAYISLIDKGQWETYRVQLKAGAATVTDFMADGTFLLNDPLQKRIHISKKRVNSQVFDTMMIFDFDCAAKIGRMEFYETRNSGNDISKQRLEWNMNTAGSEVVRQWQSHKRYNSGVVESAHNTYTIMKNITSAKAMAISWRVGINHNGTDYDYHAKKSQIVSDSGQDRIKITDAGAFTANIATASSDTTFATNLSSAISSPSTSCTNLSSPAFTTISDTPCSTLPGAYQTWSTYTSFPLADLEPGAFNGYFTSNFESIP